MTDLAQGESTVLVQAPEGASTMRVVYFFSGKKRKGSVADYLRRLCIAHKCGLRFEEVDIMVGGSEHDLLDRPSQDRYIAKMENGEYDIGVFSPPCATWSRSNFANDDVPAPLPEQGPSLGHPRTVGAPTTQGSGWQRVRPLHSPGHCGHDLGGVPPQGRQQGSSGAP